MSVQYLLMAYNKPLGFYTSVQHRAYWKISNTGQEIGIGFYASHKAEFLPFSAAPKYPQVKWPQKLSQTSHHFHQSSFPPYFPPKKSLINTTNILAFQSGILSPGSILTPSFPHQWSHLPQHSTDWGTGGGWIEQNGFDFQKWNEVSPALS